jgi:hypothetical protein
LPWRVTHATRDARDARDAMNIHVLYIYPSSSSSSSSSSHRRRIVVDCPYPNASSRATPTRASIHPSIHPSTHRRDATSRRCTKQKKSRARKYYAYYANNTYLDLRRLEGGDAGDEGGREEGRHRVDGVCENAARFLSRRMRTTTIRTSDDATIRTSDGATSRTSDDATSRTSDGATSRTSGAWRRPRGPPPSSVVVVVIGRWDTACPGRDWSH